MNIEFLEYVKKKEEIDIPCITCLVGPVCASWCNDFCSVVKEHQQKFIGKIDEFNRLREQRRNGNLFKV